MFDKDRWIEIFETIKKNKLRTFLAGFTVALGIFIFIMLFGLANGLENTFEKYFKDDQLNTIWINGSRTSKPYAGYESNRRIRLKNKDLEDIQNKYDFFIKDAIFFFDTMKCGYYIYYKNQYKIVKYFKLI